VEAIQLLVHEKLRNRKENGRFPSEYLFSGPSGAALTVPSINNLVKKWCAAVNLTGNYGGHTLRKTFGYQQVVRFKASLPEIMVLFNHANPLQTLDYLCIQPEEFRLMGRTETSKTPKPSYEELMKRIDELERTVNRLHESEEKFRTIFENVSDEIIYLDNNGTVLEINDRCEDLFGLKREEVIGKKVFDFGYVDPEEMIKIADQFIAVLDQRTSRMDELEIVRTDGAKVFIETNASFVESEGKRIGSLAIIRDITERKQMEKELQAYRDHLEELVRERTANLEEANAALRVMLRKENEVKEELEEKILINLKDLVLPALKRINDNGGGKYYLDVIESTLKNILSAFAHKLSSKYFNLTAKQLEIANLIKHGKTTKEIAELLSLSTNTIHFHRANIRKKIGISRQKANLRSFLLALE
jgi:PAS domain S-box-containing protein